MSDVGADLEDDYTPLDPTYLPPGLGDDGGAADDKNGSKELDDSVSRALFSIVFWSLAKQNIQ